MTGVQTCALPIFEAEQLCTRQEGKVGAEHLARHAVGAAQVAAAGALSAWVALVDVPQNRGCMSYIPGSHAFTNLEAQDLGDAADLFRRCPELQWQQSVTVPVKAGDVVWHHARTAHRAEANRTDTDRVVVSVIYMPQTTRFTGGKHICTEGRDYAVGELLAGDCFPVV